MSHTAGIIMGTEFPGDPRYEVRALRETEATAPPGRPLAPATWLEYAAGDGSVASTPFALKLLRAALHDQELPSVPPADPTRVENAAEYAGTYRARPEHSRRACPELHPEPDEGHARRAGARVLTLVAEGERLMLRYGDERIALERRGPNRFYVDHPDFALFLLRFGREKGEMVEAFHGPDWYTNDRYTGPTTFDHSQEWDVYPDHYRSYNPWLSNFRIVLRKGALALIAPSEPEEPLVPLGSGVFRVGEDDRSPERIRFDTILNGRTLRANLSCDGCYRTFTP